MAVDYGIEILIDVTISGVADKYADILQRILRTLASDTLSVTYAASYSAGSGSTNEITITVGGTGTVGFGIRIIVDETAYTPAKMLALELRVLRALSSEATTVAHAAGYTAGDRAYQATITVS